MKHFHTYRFNEILKLILFIATLLILLVFSKENLESVKQSSAIFLQSVFPSLFPFILFTNIILNTNITNILDKVIGKSISYIFNIPKNSSIAIITGFLCGFPMGAKSVATLYGNGEINYTTAKKLLFFVNNCNPSFILSTIGLSMFYNIKIGILLLISHYIASIIMGIIYTRLNLHTIIHEKDDFLNSFNEKSGKTYVKDETFFNIIKKGISSSFITLGTILGFIIIFNLLFSVIKTYLLKLNIDNIIIATISCIFEVTKGCSDISNLNSSLDLKLILSSFGLGFSGLCIIAQIYSTISDFKFKFSDIIIPKFIQGIISAQITYILIKFTNIFNTSTLNVFNNTNSEYMYYLDKIKNAYLTSTIIIVLGLMLYLIFDNIYKKSSHKTTLLKKGGKH